MLVKWDGKDYTLDIEAITVSQARVIKRATQLTPLKLQDALGEADPDALAALYWLMLNQNGVAADIHRIDFKIVDFANAIDEALTAEANAKPEENEVPKDQPRET